MKDWMKTGTVLLFDSPRGNAILETENRGD